MNIFSITFEDKDRNKVSSVLVLANKYNAEYLEFDTKDGYGYEFEFFSDDERTAFTKDIEKLSLFKD